MLGTSTSQIYKKVKMEISKCTEKQRTGKDIVYKKGRVLEGTRVFHSKLLEVRKTLRIMFIGRRITVERRSAFHCNALDDKVRILLVFKARDDRAMEIREYC